MSERVRAVGWRVGAVICTAFLSSMAAFAAPPPPNDLRANATVVGALPFSELLDTTGATASADEVPPCENRLAAGVWYTYTATADTQLVVETLGSNYATVVYIVYDADPSIFSCGPGNAVFGMGPGVKVSIMISKRFTGDSGGNLAVSIHGVTPSANDAVGSATAVPVLPFTDVVDVSGATIDTDDLQVNNICGFFLQHTVWYAFTAGPDDTSLLVDTTDDNHNVGPSSIIISTGSPGALSSLACGSGKVAAHTTPGTTYYVLIDNYYGSVPVTLSKAPLEPSFTMSIDGQGTIDRRTGTAKLTGTYVCVGDDAEYSAVSGVLSQTKGSHTVRQGFFSLSTAICDGNLHPFSVTALDPRRQVPPGLVLDPFVPGTATAQGMAIVCSSAWGCFQFPVQPTAVQLVR